MDRSLLIQTIFPFALGGPRTTRWSYQCINTPVLMLRVDTAPLPKLIIPDTVKNYDNHQILY